MRRALLAAMLATLTSGCAGTPGPAARPAMRQPAAPSTPRSAILRVPEVMAPAGLDGVIGTRAETLTRRFGPPRLDVAEGDARKLQFAGATCVLDIYLYPLTPGAEPTAAHIEARQRQGGGAADRGACIDEVEAR